MTTLNSLNGSPEPQPIVQNIIMPPSISPPIERLDYRSNFRTTIFQDDFTKIDFVPLKAYKHPLEELEPIVDKNNHFNILGHISSNK